MPQTYPTSGFQPIQNQKIRAAQPVGRERAARKPQDGGRAWNTKRPPSSSARPSGSRCERKRPACVMELGPQVCTGFPLVNSCKRDLAQRALHGFPWLPAATATIQSPWEKPQSLMGALPGVIEAREIATCVGCESDPNSHRRTSWGAMWICKKCRCDTFKREGTKADAEYVAEQVATGEASKPPDPLDQAC